MKVPLETFAKKTRLLRKDGFAGELHELPNHINQTKCFGKTSSSSESSSYQVVTTGPDSVIIRNEWAPKIESENKWRRSNSSITN